MLELAPVALVFVVFGTLLIAILKEWFGIWRGK